MRVPFLLAGLIASLVATPFSRLLLALPWNPARCRRTARRRAAGSRDLRATRACCDRSRRVRRPSLAGPSAVPAAYGRAAQPRVLAGGPARLGAVRARPRGRPVARGDEVRAADVASGAPLERRGGRSARRPRTAAAPCRASYDAHLAHLPALVVELRRERPDIAHALYPTDALAALRRAVTTAVHPSSCRTWASRTAAPWPTGRGARRWSSGVP